MAELPTAQQQSGQNTGQTDPQSRHPVTRRIGVGCWIKTIRHGIQV
ncbi:MAG: hypothetical protein VB913_05140 [Rhodospirillales bacterium]